MDRKTLYKMGLATALVFILVGASTAAAQVAVNSGVDFYNRYVWRGLDIANTPSIQPSLSLTHGGLELGVWGAYTLSNEASESDEIDFWLSYAIPLRNGASIGLLATDYYFPNAGIDFFNFNNHDAMTDDTIPDPGAHTVELGLSITGPETFPLTLSAFVNVYNDAGSNTYFQLDYPLSVGETELDLFCGAAGGSKDNPDYYGTENFNAINIGVSAARDIVVSDSFSLPLTVSVIINPHEEISHLVVGMSF